MAPVDVDDDWGTGAGDGFGEGGASLANVVYSCVGLGSIVGVGAIVSVWFGGVACGEDLSCSLEIILSKGFVFW